MTEKRRLPIEKKIGKQMSRRGWNKELMAETIDNPHRTKTTKDSRYKPDGQRRDDPATAYIRADGSYVVLNDETGEIVQVSDRDNPDWRLPF